MRLSVFQFFVFFFSLMVPVQTSLASGGVIHVPEYENTLEKVVLSLPAKVSQLVYHEDLLTRFPSYTEFLILVEGTNLPILQKNLEGKPYASRVKLIPYYSKNVDEGRYFTMVDKNPTLAGVFRDRLWPQGTVWARDSFVACKDQNGEPVLMVPTYYRNIVFPSVNVGEKSHLQFDNDYLKSLRGLGVHMQKSVPLVFDGGNVFFDNLGGKSVALVGKDSVRASVALSRAIKSGMDEAAILDSFKTFFNVDNVAIVGIERQPQLLFHLDQAMAPLPGGIAAVVKTVGTMPESDTEKKQVEEVREFLSHLRIQLHQLGYTIIDVETSMDAVLHRRFPNMVVYTNRETGKVNLLLSTYSDDSELDAQLREKNIHQLQERGYVVDHVNTDANRNNGGVHCLYNTL
ncbi:hypothetical protein [Pseudodesulfovibrio piezophilus]|uniref:Agmatine deiminase n=1 Tax=Pseudodesulfovibrio piezophilus (strain DSM 21447 / JCM 15486 / C1TLV30) TaxID=1322246 RepID=M1WU25_PSEP2|nr:hypothetical protein [Pseudodesulfovibrio piezophilus]CCH50157.1 exported protein of unknown function [Pseudodesulfovibrio piezophilus C1TLV30]